MAVQRQVGSMMDCKPSGADLTGQEFHFATVDGNGALVLPALGGDAYGVIQEGKPVGQHSTVATGNQLKVVAAVAINEGDKITTAADGRARVVAAGQHVLGRALSAAAAGELVEFNFERQGILAA
jgi:hypothetical protein